MPTPFAPFSVAAVRAQLSPASHLLLRRLSFLDTVDSTNRFLQMMADDEQHGHVVVADRQTAGRGRRGRNWHSPPGCNIYLSLGWRFEQPGSELTPLPLAVAVCLARAIDRAGVPGPGIKWPNDLQLGGKKLAGILVELRTISTGRSLAVMGIGLNVRMPAEETNGKAIGQPWTDVSSHLLQAADPGLRDRLCGFVVDELLQGVRQFVGEGFAPFEADWRKWDALCGKKVVVSCASEVVSGRANGITPGGGLLISCQSPGGEEQLREFFAGEVSLRPAAPL